MLGHKDGYNNDQHRDSILRYLDTLIDATLVRESSRESWRQELSTALDQIHAGTSQIPSTLGSITNAFSDEHSGIVMFRF